MEHDPVIEALVEGFVAEAREICQRATAHILELEHADKLDEAGRRKHFDDLARGLHTLKGNSDTFGFPHLAELAHKLEDVVGVYRPSLSPLPNPATDVLLRSIDVFMSRLASRNSEVTQPSLDELFAALSTAAQAPRPAPPIISRETTPGIAVPAFARSPSGAVTRTTTRAAVSTTPTPVPQDESVDTALLEDWRVGPRHVEALLREVERLRELRLRLDEQKRDIDRAFRLLQRLRSSEAGDLRTILTSLARGLTTDSDDAGDVVESLEQELKTIATLPMRWVLDPLQRAVRDLCRGLGKEAKLSCVGAEISLDRRLLDALKGPLVHLVRNAIDHGIERPDIRVAAGKHREGAITIRIERGGNMVFIDVEDDGAGVDPERIRREALARGVVSNEEADTMNDRDLHQLLFRPGFSTRAQVTEISGRGVGLDVVRAAVQAHSGHVELHTTPGSGSRFVLTMPATLGSTPILVVRAAEHLLGIPMASVETIRAVRTQDVQVGRTTSRFEHIGQLLPLVDLASVLGLRAPAPTTVGQPILIMKSRGNHIALGVDELIGDRDLVVRPLPPEIHDLPAYQGAATQARGDLLLVLQPGFLVEGQSLPTSSHAAARRVLVVDDSLTARALHRTILESGGYQVHTVSNARQAIDHLGHAYYDVMVADVMMAEIDGVQLTGMLRARRETRTLPIILVSAHDTAPDRERGMTAGADAYLSKKECISGRLLAEVAAAISRRERTT